jgi:hypothetical protein
MSEPPLEHNASTCSRNGVIEAVCQPGVQQRHELGATHEHEDLCHLGGAGLCMDEDHEVSFIEQLNGEDPLAVLLVTGRELLITLEVEPFHPTVTNLGWREFPAHAGLERCCRRGGGRRTGHWSNGGGGPRLGGRAACYSGRSRRLQNGVLQSLFIGARKQESVVQQGWS